MIKLESNKFKEIIKELDNLTKEERVSFFSLGGPDRFLIWWFYYYNDEFITLLAPFHYEWIEALFSGKNVFIEGFRGSIKTSIVIKYITYNIIINSFSFGTWQSFGDDSSKRNTTQIAINLKNENIEKDFGVLFSFAGSREDFEKKSLGDFDTKNGIKILSSSLGQKLRGALTKNKRVDLLVLDDIDVDDSVKNPEVIEKNFFKITGETFGAMDKKKSQIIFLGNTILRDGVVPRIREEKKTDKNRIVFFQPLIVDDEVKWDFFKPEMIEKIKSNEGPIAYNANYLLIPRDNYDSGFVKREMLRYFDYYNIDDFDELFMHCDTTHTGKETSDYFALGVLGKNKKDNNFYLLDFILEKIDVEKQARNSILFYQRFASKVKKFTFDEKANQGFGFWIKKLAREEYNISLPIEELKYSNDKFTHFEPHIPHFISNRVYIPANHKDLQELVIQLISFPNKGIHDDAVDMFSGVLDNFNNDKTFFTGFF